jgi:predicted RNA-binding protein with PUA-like domain
MSDWILKTEPSEYSFDQLRREKRTVWDGVTNNLALLHLRGMRKGDRVVFYHTGNERRVVGTGRVVSDPHPPAGTVNSRLLVVDVEVGEPLPRSVPLDEFRTDPILSKTDLIRVTRLSVVPLTEEQWDALMGKAGIDSRPRRAATSRTTLRPAASRRRGLVPVRRAKPAEVRAKKR